MNNKTDIYDYVNADEIREMLLDEMMSLKEVQIELDLSN